MSAGSVLRPLDRQDHREVVALLDRHPERDVYLRSLVWRLGVTLPETTGQLLGWLVGDELRGVFLHSQVVVLACEDEEGLEAFASFVAGCGALVPLAQLVSPRAMADVFLRRLAALGARPDVRLLSGGLQALQLDRESLAPSSALPSADFLVPAPVKQATEADLGLTAHAVLSVTREELGFGIDPGDEPLFTAALERRIRAGREYLWTERRRLLFRAAISAATPEAVLLEGVYVPPEERGSHRGTWAMHALCDRLLRWHRSVVLFVGHDNDRARRVYERIGFQAFEDFLAVYFELPAFDPRREAHQR